MCNEGVPVSVRCDRTGERVWCTGAAQVMVAAMPIPGAHASGGPDAARCDRAGCGATGYGVATGLRAGRGELRRERERWRLESGEGECPVVRRRGRCSRPRGSQAHGARAGDGDTAGGEHAAVIARSARGVGHVVAGRHCRCHGRCRGRCGRRCAAHRRSGAGCSVHRAGARGREASERELDGESAQDERGGAEGASHWIER